MKKFTAILSAWVLLSGLGTSSFAADEGADIRSRRGDASPSVAASQINNYVNQDEQVNLGPDDQDILVLRTDQKNLLNRYVTREFPLKNVHPRELRNVMRELTAKEGGRAEIIRDKKGGANFLQVICPDWQAKFIEQIVPLMDEKWVEEFNDGSVQLYYKATHRDIEDVDTIAENYGGEGFTAFDENNNAAVRSDEPYRVDEWLKAAKLADIPEHQGVFHVKIYEVNGNADTKIGLDYIAWKNGPGRNLFEFGFAGYKASEEFKWVSSYLSPFGPRENADTPPKDYDTYENYSRWGQANFLLTASYVDFLSSKGKAKTLAQGDIQVKSGSVGTFEAIDQVVAFVATPLNPGPYGFVPERINDIDDDTAPSGDYAIHERRLTLENVGSVGIAIEIEPVILMESIELDIAVAVSSVNGMTPQGMPIINVNETVTSARMADGATLVIGGLQRTEKLNSKSGMPFFSSLPILGYAFGGETNFNRTKQIVVVIEADVDLGGDSKLANPAALQTLNYQVSGDTKVELPRNFFGFDQWLLGSGSGANL